MEQSIELYHDLYIICGTLGLVFVVIAILLYYLFDISKILKDMLGITKKTAIREMEERDDKILKYQEKIREMQHKVAGTAEKAAARVKAQFIEQEVSEQDRNLQPVPVDNPIKESVPVDADGATMILPENQIPSDMEAPTEVLPENQVRAETARLSSENMIQYDGADQGYIPRGDTMVLNAMQMTEDTEPPKEVKQRQIRFILEKQILMTHTDEVIDF